MHIDHHLRHLGRCAPIGDRDLERVLPLLGRRERGDRAARIFEGRGRSIDLVPLGPEGEAIGVVAAAGVQRDALSGVLLQLAGHREPRALRGHLDVMGLGLGAVVRGSVSVLVEGLQVVVERGEGQLGRDGRRVEIGDVDHRVEIDAGEPGDARGPHVEGRLVDGQVGVGGDAGAHLQRAMGCGVADGLMLDGRPRTGLGSCRSRCQRCERDQDERRGGGPGTHHFNGPRPAGLHRSGPAFPPPDPGAPARGAPASCRCAAGPPVSRASSRRTSHSHRR